VLGPGDFADMGGHGGAGIRLTINDGIIVGNKKEFGKDIGVSEKCR